jgi:mannosylglucosylglycerate synthase
MGDWGKLRVVKIGMLSYRISGNDGVSLEAKRWKEILGRMGHEVVLIAGELDEKGTLVPGLCFLDKRVKSLHDKVIFRGHKFDEVAFDVFDQAKELKKELIKEVDELKLDKLVVANVLSLPIHFSAAVALNGAITELGLATKSRNHDFWWERDRYKKMDCRAFFEHYFVPDNRLITHVTINSIAQKEFAKKWQRKSVVIPDCFDFGMQIPKKDGVREMMGLTDADIVFLQATRIVPRKRIEFSIELVTHLGDPRVVLVLAGTSGDEGNEYLDRLREVSRASGIRMKFVGDMIEEGKFTLWEALAECDLMTYPSEYEGFGNQFIEAVAAKKPICVNRYPVYRSDIEPLGFECVAFDGQVTDEVVNRVRKWMENKELVRDKVEKNWQIGRENFSYEATSKRLTELGF